MATDRMQPVPLFRGHALRPLLDYLDRRHGGAQRLFGAELGVLRDPNSVLPYSAGGRAFDVAARAHGLPELGLLVGESTRPHDIGAFGMLVRRAPTVASALEAMVRFGSHFNTGQRFRLVSYGDELWLHREHSRALERGRQQVSDFALVVSLQLFRLAAGPHWRPLELRFEGPPPAHAERLAELAQRRVYFGCPSTVVVLPRSILALPLPPASQPGGDPHASELSLPSQDAEGSLYQMVEGLLRLGEAQVEAAAEAAGTSVRSFQRRLARAGLRFAELLQRVRCRAAYRLLADPGLKVVEVSAALGYTDSANFTRAFRRWTGVSPQEFRRVAADLAPPVTAVTGGSSPLASLPIAS